MKIQKLYYLLMLILLLTSAGCSEKENTEQVVLTTENTDEVQQSEDNLLETEALTEESIKTSNETNVSQLQYELYYSFPFFTEYWQDVESNEIMALYINADGTMTQTIFEDGLEYSVDYEILNVNDTILEVKSLSSEADLKTTFRLDGHSLTVSTEFGDLFYQRIDGIEAVQAIEGRDSTKEMTFLISVPEGQTYSYANETTLNILDNYTIPALAKVPFDNYNGEMVEFYFYGENQVLGKVENRWHSNVESGVEYGLFDLYNNIKNLVRENQGTGAQDIPYFYPGEYFVEARINNTLIAEGNFSFE